MSFLFKVILGGSVLALISYLIVEVFKLRTKIKSLTLQLSTTEKFNSNTPSSTEIQTEIDEYKKELAELHSLDTMVDKIRGDIDNEDAEYSEDYETYSNQENDIDIKEESIDYDEIENDIEQAEEHSLQIVMNTGDVESVEGVEGVVENVESVEGVVENVESVEGVVENVESVEGVEGVVESVENNTEHTTDDKNITESDMQFLLQKYNKNELKQLCSENSLTKGGSKAELIKRLLNKNLLQKELPNNNILNSLELSPEELQSIEDTTGDTIDDTTQNNISKENVSQEAYSEDVSIEEVNTEDLQASLQNVPIDSLLYSLREINNVSNEDSSYTSNNLQF